MVAPLGNNSSTLNDEPCLSSYILQNFSRRKWPDFADVYVNCITELFIFFFNCKKKNHEMACLLLSFGAGTNPFALFFGDSVIFFLWFNLLEFLWIYFTEIKKSRQNLILQSSDGSIIKHHLSLSLSNRVQYSPNTENQIYSTECLFSCHLPFSNHNDKISVLSSKNDYFSKQLRNRKFELICR